MRLWLYRLLDIDDDGDPLDHGIIAAKSTARAAEILAARLVPILENWQGTARFYDCGPTKHAEGVVEIANYETYDMPIVVGDGEEDSNDDED